MLELKHCTIDTLGREWKGLKACLEESGYEGIENSVVGNGDKAASLENFSRV